MSLPLPYGVGAVDPQSPIDWSHPLNRGLVAEWTILPNSGWRGGVNLRNIARGSSKLPYVGTLVNTPSWVDQRPNGYGALKFNGSNTYVNFGNNLPFGTSNFTIAVWFKTTNTVSTQYVVAKSLFGSGMGRFGLGFNDGGTGIMALLADAGGNGVTTTPVSGFADGNWHFAVVTVVRSTGLCTLYVDGASRATATTSDTSTNWSGFDLELGAYNDSGGNASTNLPYSGSADGLMQYNRALTATEVRNLYQETKNGNPNRWRWLLRGAWFPPDQGGGTAYTLNLEAGSYTVTGVALTPLWHRRLNLAAGSYTITGAAATLLANRKLNCEAGSYSITGASATLLANRNINLAAGSYTITGAALTPLWHRKINLAAGSYTITGAAAELVKGGSTTYTLSLDAGSYSITGAALTPLWHRRLNLAAGSYTITGAAMSFATGADPYTDIAGTWAFPEIAGTWAFPEVAGTWEST